MIDRSTGRLNTKIEGRLQWNLDGSTNSAKARKPRLNSKPQSNLIEYRRTPSPAMKKQLLNFEATTYRQVFGGIDNTNNLQLLTDRNASVERNFGKQQEPVAPLKATPLNIEKEAEARNLSRYLKPNDQNRPNNSLYSNVTARNNYDLQSGNSPRRTDFNNNSQNFVSNSYSNKNEAPRPYDYAKWFGNGGGGAPTSDARRRKLMDMLENRHLYNPELSERRAQSDLLYTKTTTSSSHKNNYENSLQGKNY
jgi:hypothetical protein